MVSRQASCITTAYILGIRQQGKLLRPQEATYQSSTMRQRHGKQVYRFILRSGIRIHTDQLMNFVR